MPFILCVCRNCWNTSQCLLRGPLHSFSFSLHKADCWTFTVFHHQLALFNVILFSRRSGSIACRPTEHCQSELFKTHCTTTWKRHVIASFFLSFLLLLLLLLCLSMSPSLSVCLSVCLFVSLGRYLSGGIIKFLNLRRVGLQSTEYQQRQLLTSWIREASSRLLSLSVNNEWTLLNYVSNVRRTIHNHFEVPQPLSCTWPFLYIKRISQIQKYKTNSNNVSQQVVETR